jgi:DNA-binding transcriptional MerR regulator
MFENSIRQPSPLRIGAAAQLFGMTARALRFYEAKGLLSVRRDRQNCRYYDACHRARLSWIRLLRGAGLPLRDIRDVLECGDGPGQARDCAIGKLEARKRHLQLKLALVEMAELRLGLDMLDNEREPLAAD